MQNKKDQIFSLKNETNTSFFSDFIYNETSTPSQTQSNFNNLNENYPDVSKEIFNVKLKSEKKKKNYENHVEIRPSLEINGSVFENRRKISFKNDIVRLFDNLKINSDVNNILINEFTTIKSKVFQDINSQSILCVVVSVKKGLIFCGSQNLKIIVYDIKNQFSKTFWNCGTDTNCSVLSLAITDDENFLFSGGTDSLVKVWNISRINEQIFIKNLNQKCNFESLFTIYSLVDIGDILSIVWCNLTSTIFIGTQSCSILWCKLFFNDNRISFLNCHSLFEKLPKYRYDKFFDSKGPGENLVKENLKILTSSLKCNDFKIKINSNLVEVDFTDMIQFAHNGFIYCMEILNFDSINNFFSENFESNKASFIQFLKNSYKINCKNFLLSCGGDGLVIIWAIIVKNNKIQLKKIDFFINQKAILTMSIKFPYLYVGINNVTINIWNLVNFTKVHSLQLSTSNKTNNNYNEVLSICVDDDFFYKSYVCGKSIRVDLNLYLNLNFCFKNKTLIDKKSCLQKTTLNLTKSHCLEKFENKISTNLNKLNTVLITKIFKFNNVKYLLSGNIKSFHLWKITDDYESGLKFKLEKFLLLFKKFNSALNNDKNDSICLFELFYYYLYEFIFLNYNFKSLSKNIDSSTKFLLNLFVNLGSDSAFTLPTVNKVPIIVSIFKKNNTKTTLKENNKRILLYSHYDVLSFNSNFFGLDIKNDYLSGDGLSRNKGPLLTVIFSIAELYANSMLSYDVVFLIEGNHFKNSIGLEKELKNYKDLIGEIDFVIFLNSNNSNDESFGIHHILHGSINFFIKIKSHPIKDDEIFFQKKNSDTEWYFLNVLNQFYDTDKKKIKIENFYDDIKIENFLVSNSVITENDFKNIIHDLKYPELNIDIINVMNSHNDDNLKSINAKFSIETSPFQNSCEIEKKISQFFNEKFEPIKLTNKIHINYKRLSDPWICNFSSFLYKKLNICAKNEIDNLKKKKNFDINHFSLLTFFETFFDANSLVICCGSYFTKKNKIVEELKILDIIKLRNIIKRIFF